LLAVAKAAERHGFDAFFRSDHYLKMGGVDGRPGPSDAWITLAGLARETTRIHLGTLVTSATFRYPGPLAISVAQVDAMSGGRVELGLGAGWYGAEHDAYAIPFPPLGERFERFEEQLHIITGLWATPSGATFEYTGKHYSVKESPGLPKPAQKAVPIIIGGGGAKRTPRLAAEFASEFNTPFQSVETFSRLTAQARAACETRGRDPQTLIASAALVVCIGEDEAEFTKRAKAIGREPGELRENGVAGLPHEAAEKLRTFQAAGAQRVYLQVLDLGDLDHIEQIADALFPAIA
jgi:F420-dependent oxidoreductase-like protein